LQPVSSGATATGGTALTEGGIPL